MRPKTMESPGTGPFLLYFIGLWGIHVDKFKGSSPVSRSQKGDVKFSMIVSTMTMWLCRVALCVFLEKVFHFGPMAVWIGMFADWTIRSFIFAGRFLSGKWLNNQVI